MGTVLQFISLLYMAAIGAAAYGAFSRLDAGQAFLAVLIGLAAALPAIILYAFGGLARDVTRMHERMKEMTDHLKAMRAFFEQGR